MELPGPGSTQPIFQNLVWQQQWLQHGVPLPNNAQFKCFDGWAMLNQVQPAPTTVCTSSRVWHGQCEYRLPATSNFTGRSKSPVTATQMLRQGKYVSK